MKKSRHRSRLLEDEISVSRTENGPASSFFPNFFRFWLEIPPKPLLLSRERGGNCIIAAALKELIETARIPALAAGQKIEQKIGPNRVKQKSEGLFSQSKSEKMRTAVLPRSQRGQWKSSRSPSSSSISSSMS
jgi:hypothetical protein